MPKPTLFAEAEACKAAIKAELTAIGMDVTVILPDGSCYTNFLIDYIVDNIFFTLETAIPAHCTVTLAPAGVAPVLVK